MRMHVCDSQPAGTFDTYIICTHLPHPHSAYMTTVRSQKDSYSKTGQSAYDVYNMQFCAFCRYFVSNSCSEAGLWLVLALQTCRETQSIAQKCRAPSLVTQARDGTLKEEGD